MVGLNNMTRLDPMKNTKTTLLFGGDLCVGHEDVLCDEALVGLCASKDVVMVNIEAPIEVDGEEAKAKSGPALRQSLDALSKITDRLSVTAVGIANNHISDYGEGAVVATKEAFERLGIQVTGAGKNAKEAEGAIYIEGTSICILCAGEEEFGVADLEKAGMCSLQEQGILERIAHEKAKGNTVILFAHAGVEQEPLPTKWVQQRFRSCIDAGAEMVIGHHPHVIQGKEQYKGKSIYYSLGNIWHQLYPTGIGMLVEIEVDEEGVKKETQHLVEKQAKELVLIQDATRLGSVRKYVSDVSAVLSDPMVYEQIYQEQTMSIYEMVYKKYLFRQITHPWISAGRILAKNILRGVQRTKQEEELLFAHLVRNASHGECIKTALLMLTGEQKDVRTKASQKKYVELKEQLEGLK